MEKIIAYAGTEERGLIPEHLFREVPGTSIKRFSGNTRAFVDELHKGLESQRRYAKSSEGMQVPSEMGDDKWLMPQLDLVYQEGKRIGRAAYQRPWKTSHDQYQRMRRDRWNWSAIQKHE